MEVIGRRSGPFHHFSATEHPALVAMSARSARDSGQGLLGEGYVGVVVSSRRTGGSDLVP